MDKKSYFHWGLTVFLTAAAMMVFYDTVFRNGILLNLLRTLNKALSPVIYGAAMAYLLAPAVNFFDRCILSMGEGKTHPMLARALSIFMTWVIVFFLFYLFFSILIPQLYTSVVTLINNMQSYYNTVYQWSTQLLERNPRVAAIVKDGINEYWGSLGAWFTNTFLPQAQQTLTMVTSGVLSVFAFFRDFLVGVIVSVYLLALKERFGVGGRRLLYSWVSERTYRHTLRALEKADAIFSGFVRGKLLDSIIIGILCFIGASILRLPYTPLVSVIVGVTNIIPFFGPFLGAIPCGFLILLVSPVKCLYFIIFILILQQIDGNVIGPKILGGSTELPSFWVIVAILIGGGFFGVAGMFLGVPVFALLYAAIGYFSRKRLKSKNISSDEPFLSNDAIDLSRQNDAKPQQGEPK
ncbi:MAG: AI-2E family transporter [Ruminococcaceae bacterium]|nr:AI-2E family transporter [Oscillospiraceae bacterium]